ncbi:MAG TPA: HD domain-containing phosphohydrolase [Desulfobacterales bacterium]|nr:HD domain-containing phosphohydrolase [Desulfobacterales bacterium]
MDDIKREHLLVVDDEAGILNVVSEYFTRRGYEVLTARNGREALQVLRSRPIDCCFTDISMPEMNGLELAEHIHRDHSSLPVIVMTGYPSLDASIRTLKNGVVDFLIKPVNLKQMELSLRRVMRQRTLMVENLLLKEEVAGKDRLEKLNAELQARVEELHTLNRIMGHFAVAPASANVLQRAVDIALDVANADRTGFFVVSGSPHEIASADRRPGEPSGFPAVEETLREMVMTVSADGQSRLAAGTTGDGGAADHSRMAVPVKIRGKIFGVLTAVTRPGGRVFTERDLFFLAFTTQSAANAIENMALYENLYENLFATLYGFVNALEARDLYTRQHSSRVTEIALVLGRELGCSNEELTVLNFAGPLHDIGKIGIRDEILLKPDRLSTDEFEKIKEHPVIGANMLNQLGLWERERQIIRCHHERFDGSGYPDGLRREEIPFLARILSVADAYDAMASDRAYRKRMEEALILRIIQEGSGTQFDPLIVTAFQKAYLEGKIAAPGISA